MKEKTATTIIIALLTGSAANSLAATHYVKGSSILPTPPYLSWETAATNIQDAVDVAAAGEMVKVGSGTYTPLAEISITNAITVVSVGGPGATIVSGQNTHRCFNVGSSACTLSGFRIISGRAAGASPGDRGGGIYCSNTTPFITNCTLTGNSADFYGGGCWRGTLSGCTLSANSANYGGGCCESLLYNCFIEGNSAYAGGGSQSGELLNCMITGNSAATDGGGSRYGTLINCTLVSNSANNGGGCYAGTYINSIVRANSATNSGDNFSGSPSFSYSCTTPHPGGDNNVDTNPQFINASAGNYRLLPASPCIDVGNNSDAAGSTDLEGNPRIMGGTIDMGAYEFAVGLLPVIDITETNTSVGAMVPAYVIHGTNNTYTVGTLFWTNTANGVNGTITVSGTTFSTPAFQLSYGPNTITVAGTSAAGYTASDSVTITRSIPPVVDITTADTTVDSSVAAYAIVGTNNVYTVGSLVWTNAANGANGSVPVTDTTFGIASIPLANGPNTITVSGTNVLGDAAFDSVTITRSTPFVYHVSPTGSSTSPYLTWETAATNIQDAVDICINGLTVLVANGTYTSLTEITVSHNITVKSVNGPDYTIVDGGGTHRVFNLEDSACTLSGFTVANGLAAGTYGGGISCTDTTPFITNCVIAGNTAGTSGGGIRYGTLYNCTLSNNTAQAGGGSWQSTLIRCSITDNTATFSYGGGCFRGTLSSCIFTGNSGVDGGGVAHCTGSNCIFVHNTAVGKGGGCYGSTLTNCTTSSNSAGLGGGSAACDLVNCILNMNSATAGGGSNGGTLTNCTLTLNSANDGGGSYAGTLNNCTLSGNTATRWGGGSHGSTLNNCSLTENSAETSGGGSYLGTLNNCLVAENSAIDEGGGGYAGTFNNCTVTGNSAGDKGGGNRNCTLRNCIVWGNSATTSNDNWYDTGSPDLFCCCTTPDPGGAGNVAADPLFISTETGDYRISMASPCIDAGSNTYVNVATDLDGNPRIANGTVDIGAFEYVGSVDSDGDLFSDQEEFIAGTDPTNAASFFRITNTWQETSGFVIEWAPTLTGRWYSVVWTNDLPGGFQTLKTGIDHPQNSATDSAHNAESEGFYKVEVQLK
ncbi:choice-of-anchor Q domain-containing protein [Pontiellaceae bacterium B12227]|nr:choice-of-anchor Q domain-containing protein [Pontiellaceae bacterium B12227]